jgi:hypothetical protein
VKEKKRGRKREQEVLNKGGDWINISIDGDVNKMLIALREIMGGSKAYVIRECIKYLYLAWKMGDVNFVDNDLPEHYEPLVEFEDDDKETFRVQTVRARGPKVEEALSFERMRNNVLNEIEEERLKKFK